MGHNKNVQSIAGKTCYVYCEDNSQFVLLQPVDSHDVTELDHEVEQLEQLTDKSFTLVAFKIEKWNAELTPWPAPPVFGKIPFGNGGPQTLDYIIENIIPVFCLPDTKIILGGYSLAGFFSIWAAFQSDIFYGTVSASPSIWYPNWIKYSEEHDPLVKHIYLSLGDKEEHTKSVAMKQVAVCMRREYEILQDKGINSILEWNPGNHFQDNGLRTAKGFAWVMGQ